MNNKRQTIWLVSMLSLMVILSAYYLFTGDSSPSAPPVAESTQMNGQNLDMDMDSANNPDEIVVTETGQEDMAGNTETTEGNSSTEVTPPATGSEEKPASDPKTGKSEEATDKGANTESGDGKSDQAAGSKETSKTDEDILNEVATTQAGSASEKLDSYMLDRANQNMKLYDDLLTKLNDQNATPEETAKVTEQMRALDEKESILTGIEERLQQQYENAVVKEENNRYNVVVLSDQMDAKSAANIVDMVMKELKVTQDKVSVQYITP